MAEDTTRCQPSTHEALGPIPSTGWGRTLSKHMCIYLGLYASEMPMLYDMYINLKLEYLDSKYESLSPIQSVFSVPFSMF